MTIRDHAESLLRGGSFGNPLVAGSGRIGEPIEVQTPDGRLHSWFVPVIVSDRLAGFFQFLPDLTLMRYSSFQRMDDSLEGCPAAESWIDPAAIRRQAENKARPGETVGAPVFTYDRAPSRLAWAIPLKSQAGATRTLFIAGNAAWEGSDADSYGGPA